MEMTRLPVLTRFAVMLVLLPAALAFGETAVDASKAGFYRLYWHQRGVEHGNPHFNNRFRVNAPEVVLHPTFKTRPEVKDNGMMQIRIEEDLSLLEAAGLYLEVWGGHPGTANKRVIVNGRSTYHLPEVGTAEKHCTHEYPVFELKITDLVNGFNALQFACDTGTTFWGHFIVDNACLRLKLEPSHPDLQAAGLEGFAAKVRARPEGDERISLSLEYPDSLSSAVSEVQFQGYYYGYDENGDGHWRDWHGFTKNKASVGHIGSTSDASRTVSWDLSLVPDQDQPMAVRAVVRFRNHPELVYLTPPVSGLAIPNRRNHRVILVRPDVEPTPFWSRAGNLNTCLLQLDLPMERIEQAYLHTVTWDGGRGEVEEYFTLNGHFLPVAGKGDHDVLYTILPVPREVLRQGSNEIRLLSDTRHHGIEVLRPGPVLVLRLKTEADQ
jgi:hypothetical protein